MTTASGAFNVIKSRLLANKPAALSAYRFQNEDEDSAGNKELPNSPTPFAYAEFVTDPGRLVSFGGGRGNNRYRNPGRLDVYVFTPKGEGLTGVTDLAETIAALFRSYRDDDISCFDATVHPGGQGSDFRPAGVASEVDNYFVAVAEISMHFDLIG